MTTDFRALCADLINELHGYKVGHPSHDTDLIDRARAALADEPAVPEGRESVAVTGQPSSAELLDLHEWMTDEWAANHGFEMPPIEYARAVLARWGNPVPAPPADGEVAELVELLRHEARDSGPHEGAHPSWCAAMERAAELLQRQALVPVSVSERLPGPEDCDEEGRCWWWYPPVPEQNYGYWIYEDNAVPERSRLEWPDSWLPAHALPLPEVK